MKNGVVTFANSKSRLTRSIPIYPDLERTLLDYFKAQGPFPNCIRYISRVPDSTSIKLPHGQVKHVLRHTFAYPFVITGGTF